MQLTNVLVSFLLAATVSAKGSKNGTESVKAQCQSFQSLTQETALAANDTKLATVFKNNQTKIDAFKAKAANATTKLNTLSSNSTLMASCAVIQAHNEAVSSCGQISSIEKEVALAANTTALSDKFDGNTTKIDAFTAKASAAATKLTTLQSNTTLTTFCSVQKTVQDCNTITALQKSIAKAANATAVTSREKGNSTDKAAKLQAQAAKDQTKLDALTSNSTLMSACSSLASEGVTNAANAAQTASPAGRIEAAGSMIGAAVLALTAAMVVL